MHNKRVGLYLAAGLVAVSISGCSATTTETANSDKTACDGIYLALGQVQSAQAEWLTAWASNDENQINRALDLSSETLDFDKTVEKILPTASSKLKNAVSEIQDKYLYLTGGAILGDNDSVATENLQVAIDSLNEICAAAGSTPLE